VLLGADCSIIEGDEVELDLGIVILAALVTGFLVLNTDDLLDAFFVDNMNDVVLDPPESPHYVLDWLLLAIHKFLRHPRDNLLMVVSITH
jgi:hypothetical protein